MKNTFKELQTVDFTESNWRENSIIVFDTNVLLNLYKVTESSRKDAFKLLDSVKDQCWIPHQVGLEFYLNLDKVKDENRKKFISLREKISKSLIEHKNEVNSTFREKVEGEPSTLTGIDSTKIEALLVETKDKILDLMKIDEEDSPSGSTIVRGRLESFFDGRVGKPYSTMEFKKHCETAKLRLDAKVPPLESLEAKKQALLP